MAFAVRARAAHQHALAGKSRLGGVDVNHGVKYVHEGVGLLSCPPHGVGSLYKFPSKGTVHGTPINWAVMTSQAHLRANRFLAGLLSVILSYWSYTNLS